MISDVRELFNIYIFFKSHLCVFFTVIMKLLNSSKFKCKGD